MTAASVGWVVWMVLVVAASAFVTMKRLLNYGYQFVWIFPPVLLFHLWMLWHLLSINRRRP